MKTVSTTDIVVRPERQRQEFDAKRIDELADSISRLGLAHPIVLEPDGRTLVAGERRLRAVREFASRGEAFQHNGILVPPGHIPFTITSDLNPDELYELELEENIQRVDLSWQEKARAMSQLEALHASRRGLAPDELSVAEFARAVTGLEQPDAFRVRARETLAVAKHLDDPDVAAAKSQKEALKIVQRKNEAVLRQELQRKLAAAGFAEHAQSPHILHEGSAFDVAPTLETGKFDIILTDPPYGIDMDKMNTQSGSSSGLTHNYSDDADYAASCVELVAREGFRVTKASAVCYMFCDLRFFPRWKGAFELAGWYVWPNPIIWNKAPTGALLGQANGPRHVYETVLMAIKGNRAVNTVGNDVISIPGPSVDKRHPAEKPVDLYAHLLSWSAIPGDSIIDFFCGCGPVFPAAARFQCTAVGCEKDPAHASVARERKDAMTELL